MSKKIIVFDMDGVLFDTEEVAANYFVKVYPGLSKETCKELLCGNFHDELLKLNPEKIPETEEDEERRKLQYSEEKSKSPMYLGAKELLEYLHKENYILILNTSAWNRNCLPMLERTNITSLFDFLATAEVSKSKVEKFKMIQEKYQVQKEDMLFITDTLGDVREAEIAGVPTVAVTWGAHNQGYFEREEHTNLAGIIHTFDELKSFILKKTLETEYPIVYEWQDAPNTIYPEHSHQGKVSLYVTHGSVTFFGGIEKTVNAGERIDIPPKILHSAKVGNEGCSYIVGQEIKNDA